MLYEIPTVINSVLSMMFSYLIMYQCIILDIQCLGPFDTVQSMSAQKEIYWIVSQRVQSPNYIHWAC